jgi:plastocyanin
MKTRTILILLLCLVSAAVLVTGCTSQTSGPVTTVPTTMVPATVIAQTSGTVMTTGIPDTIRTTGTRSMPTATVTPTVSKTDDRDEKVRIKARNFAFDVSRITVPAGSQVTVEFENEDNAPHNVAFYTTPSLTTTIYKGAIIDGPAKTTYVFTAPSTPGTYFFHCDLHPSMKGEFVVI